MSTTPCPSCGQPVAGNARTCPACGHDFNAVMMCFLGFMVLAFLLFMLAAQLLHWF